jgi:hypothetical protein
MVGCVAEVFPTPALYFDFGTVLMCRNGIAVPELPPDGRMVKWDEDDVGRAP